MGGAGCRAGCDVPDLFSWLGAGDGSTSTAGLSFTDLAVGDDPRVFGTILPPAVTRT